MNKLFVGLAGCLVIQLNSLFGQANADGTFSIPLYVNPSTFGPSKYTIYASVGGGGVLPYLFDTGAPNLFTTAPGGTTQGAGSFTFATGTTYDYNIQNVQVALGNAAQQTIVSTAGAINVAQIVQINSNPTTPNQQLGDGTYGDFGAGGYGTSTLATVLTQLPLGEGVKLGYAVNVAGLSDGNGFLTLGVSQALRDYFYNNPDAIVMDLSHSGVMIPAGSGTVEGFNKTQVETTHVKMTHGGNEKTKVVGTVFDTGGGPNSIVYDGEFSGYGGGTLEIRHGDDVILFEDATTEWGGSVITDSDVSGGVRVNPGGLIYDKYEILFDIDSRKVVLVPAAVPEPSAVGLCAVGGGVVLLMRRRKRA